MPEVNIEEQGNQMKVEYRSKNKKLNFRFNDANIDENEIQLWNKKASGPGKMKAGKFKNRFNGWEYVVDGLHQYHRIGVSKNLVNKIKKALKRLG